MSIKLGIYVSSEELLKKAEELKDQLKEDLEDFVVFTDELVLRCSHAVLPSYYMRFFNGSVAFLTFEDYLTFKDGLMTDRPILFISVQEMISQNIDRSMIKNVELRQPCTTN